MPPDKHNRITLLNSKGVSLYVIVFLIFLIIALITAGILSFGPRVTKYKITSTRNNLEADVNSIISWAAANGRIPDSTTYANVLKNPNDSWGKALVYIYDSNVASTTGGGLCGRASTFITTSGTVSAPNVAFLIVSGGQDYTVDTRVGGQVPTYPTVVNSDTTVSVSSADVARVVTLTELQGKAGCFGRTGGHLRVVNTELPTGCNGNLYNASVFADGGAPFSSNGKYLWCIQNASGSAPANLTFKDQSNNNNILFSTNCLGVGNYGSSWTRADYINIGNTPTATATFPLTFFAIDTDTTTPNVIQKLLNINIYNCGAGPGNPPPTPPPPPGSSGVNTGTNAQDPLLLSQNTVSNNPGGNVNINVSGNLITFGGGYTNGAACVWYPNSFPLQGKTMRAYWNFMFLNADTYADSTQYADGYTFTVMQGSNAGTYCGTGAPNDSVLNPNYNCQYSGHFGEFLSYCGLPGQSMAVEFDIYPNYGTQSRNDPVSNHNHVAIVQTLGTHNGPPAGTYGDNTHNYAGNPACACNGTCTGTGATCTGTCNGTTINNGTCAGTCLGSCTGTCSAATTACNGKCTGTGATCTGTCDGAAIAGRTCGGTCYGTCTGTGATCNGTGMACLYGNVSGGSLPVTWLEDAKLHNARVELHTRCNPDCSSCEIASCTTKAFIKVWIDGGNRFLNTDEPSAPNVSYCIDLPPDMNQVKVGFTQATGAMSQKGQITNFAAYFVGACSQPSIAPTSLPRIQSGSSYTATLSASGGTGSYIYPWSLSCFGTSCLPNGLSFNTSTGVISGTTSDTAPYGTILVSIADTCTADTCSNTVSRSYLLCPYMSITPASLPTAIVNTAYSTTITASGGTTPYSWSTTGLPSWLSFQTSGTGSCGSTCTLSSPCLCGMPTTTGTYTPTITLADSCNDGTTVSQAYTLIVCSYSINPTSAAVGSGGITGNSVSVTAGTGCGWTATSNNPSWITITSPSSGSGSGPGTVTYSVAGNVGGARSGNMTIAGQTFTVNQQAPPPPTCNLVSNPANVDYGNTSILSWTVTNSPTSAAWSGGNSPGGPCNNYPNPNPAGGSCTTGNLNFTNGAVNAIQLTVTNAGGSNSCSAVNAGCRYYQVWNTTGNSWDFKRSDGTCFQRIGNTNQITNQLGVGQTLTRHTNNTTCGGTTYGSITYDQSMNADIAGDHDCQVNFNSSDGVTDR